MKGYQFLKNDFFNTCRIRRITKLPMLLLIYLRGLYAYYGKPTFFYKDELIMRDLGLSKNTLRHARNHLRERGVITFFTHSGRGKATRYLILETELAPDLKGSKNDRKGSKSDPFAKHEKGQFLTPNINKEIKPLNYGFSTKGNIEPEVEELLRKFKQSLA
jgi:hypothetical protein